MTSPWRALLVALLFALGLTALLSLYVYRDLQLRAEQDARDDLAQLMDLSFSTLAPLPAERRRDRMQGLIAGKNANQTGVIMLLGRDGRTLLPGMGSAPVPVVPGGEEFQLPTAAGTSALLGDYMPLPEGQTLFVGVRLAPYRSKIAGAMMSIWSMAVLLALPFGLFALYWSRQLRGRLNAMIADAERIGRGDMTARFATGNAADEFDIISRHMNIMVERLARLRRAIEDQSNHIRHEFLNAAARMGVYVQRLQKDIEDRDALERIERERSGLIAATNAILGLARASSILPQRLALDIADLAEDVVAMFEGAAEARGQVMTSHLAPAPCICDPDMLRLLFSNLVSNAIKYAPEGGRIEVSTAERKGQVQFRVQDTGPGVNAALRARIFEAGQRGTAKGAGHGYGLAIARALAQQHRGQIHVDDGELGGASFIVTLPALEDATRP